MQLCSGMFSFPASVLHVPAISLLLESLLGLHLSFISCGSLLACDQGILCPSRGQHPNPPPHCHHQQISLRSKNDLNCENICNPARFLTLLHIFPLLQRTSNVMRKIGCILSECRCGEQGTFLVVLFCPCSQACLEQKETAGSGFLSLCQLNEWAT